MLIERKASVLSPRVALPYLAAIILSLISFHTTYYGMRSFYGLGRTGSHLQNRISDPVANVVSQYVGADIENLFAICFAAVVQCGILFASAYLSLLLLNGQPRKGQSREATRSRWLLRFVAIILLLLLPISIVFSYGARLEWQIGAQQKATIQTSGAQSDATGMLNVLGGLMAEEHRRLSTTITELPQFKAWRASMDKLAKAVARSPESIRLYLKSTESAEAEKHAVERRREVEANEQALELDREADRINRDLEAIEENATKFEELAKSKPPATTEFDARIAQYEVDMKKEQEGTGSCGRAAGEGTCFNHYKAERDKAEHDKSLFLQSAEAGVRTAADRLIALKKDKMNKEVELANVIDKAKIIRHEIEIDPSAEILDPATNLPKKVAELQPVIGKYAVEFQKALDELGNGFSLETYARVSNGCRRLLPVSMIGDPKEMPNAVECNPVALEPSVSLLQNFEDHQKHFEVDCRSPAHDAAPYGADVRVSQIFDKVSMCIGLSRLGTLDIYQPRINDLSKKLANATSNRSTGVDYLTFTMGELRDGKRVAFLALFFAFAVDALVFVFTFLGVLPRSGVMVQTSTLLSNEERLSMFSEFQRINDALDESDPTRFELIRTMLTCVEVGAPDGVIRLNLGKLPNETDRHQLLRRLLPFLTSGLAWKDTQQEQVMCISDRGMSLLAQEFRRVIEREEKGHSAITEPLIPTSVDQFSRAELDVPLRIRRVEQDLVSVATPQGSAR
jgi:hypothetical protein